MTCDELTLELLAFHFGELEDPPRAAVEAHLGQCLACVGRFLSVKREVELAESAPAPSDAARARLRRAVAMEVGVRPRRKWEPLLAFAASALVVLSAAAAVGNLATGDGRMPHGLAAVRGK